MKITRKLVLMGCMISLITSFLLTGCSGEKKNSEKETTTPDVSSEIYPVTINGTEIRVGETSVQSLLDAGFKVTVSEMTADNDINEYEIDPEAELNENTYYYGASIWLSDSVFVHISLITDKEKSRMGDAVIGMMEFTLSFGDKAELQNITFNGVPVTEITREKAGEMFPDFEGDDIMWFSSSSIMKYYKYSMIFSSEDTLLTKLTISKNYDIDWN